MTNDNKPPTLPRPLPKLKPKSLTDEQIRKLNHVEWIDGAVYALSLETGVQKTPFLLGMITRLTWLSRYVKLLEEENAVLRLKEKFNDHGYTVGPKPL